MRWQYKWRKELISGQYWDLLARGFFENKPEDQEPEITGFDFYIDAFRDLSSCRPVGMDLGPIPFTAIAEYSRIYEIGDFYEFSAIIRRMDRIELGLIHQAQEREREKKSGPNNANKKNSNKR